MKKVELSKIYSVKGVQPLVSCVLKGYTSLYDSDIYLALKDKYEVELVESVSDFGINDFTSKIRLGEGFELLPTFGRLSRFGLISGCDTLNYTSLEASNMDDLVELYETIKGSSLKDLMTHEEEVNASNFIEYSFDYDLVKASFKVILGSEVFSVTSKYDGTLFGRKVEASSLEEMYREFRRDFSKEMKELIVMGAFFTSKDGRDILEKAFSFRNKLKEDFLSCLDGHIFKTTDSSIKYVALLLGLPLLRVNDTYYLGSYFTEDSLIKEALNEGI